MDVYSCQDLCLPAAMIPARNPQSLLTISLEPYDKNLLFFFCKLLLFTLVYYSNRDDLKQTQNIMKYFYCFFQNYIAGFSYRFFNFDLFFHFYNLYTKNNEANYYFSPLMIVLNNVTVFGELLLA